MSQSTIVNSVNDAAYSNLVKQSISKPVESTPKAENLTTKAPVVSTVKPSGQGPVSNETELKNQAKTTQGTVTENAQPEFNEAVSIIRESATKALGGNLSFSVDDNSGKTVLSIKDPETGEVIQQIPSEEVRKIAAYIKNNANQARLLDLSA